MHRLRLRFVGLLALGLLPASSLAETRAPAASAVPRIPPATAPTAPPPASAPAFPERRLALAPKAGVAWSAGGVRPLTLAAEATWWTRAADGHLGVTAEVGTFSYARTDTVDLSGRPVSIRGEARYLPLLLSATWRDGGGPWSEWGSLGAGAAYVDGTLDVAGAAAPGEAGWVPAAHASVAFGLRLGNATPFAEVRVAWLGDPGFARLGGSLTTLGLSLGCRYDAL